MSISWRASRRRRRPCVRGYAARRCEGDEAPRAGKAPYARASRGAAEAALRGGVRPAGPDHGGARSGGGRDAPRAESPGDAATSAGSGAQRRSSAVHALLPDGRVVDQVAARSDGAGVPSGRGVQHATRKSSTLRPCFRAVCAMVIILSAKRSPRLLWVPNERRRQSTKARSSRSAWLFVGSTPSRSTKVHSSRRGSPCSRAAPRRCGRSGRRAARRKRTCGPGGPNRSGADSSPRTSAPSPGRSPGSLKSLGAPMMIHDCGAKTRRNTTDAGWSQCDLESLI